MPGGRRSGIRGGGERGLNPPSDDLDPRFRGGLTALLAAIALFGATDLVLDRPASLFSAHVLFELAFIALCLGGVAYVWRGWLGTRAALAGSQQALRDREVERDRWRDEANRLLAGLGRALVGRKRRSARLAAEAEAHDPWPPQEWRPSH